MSEQIMIMEERLKQLERSNKDRDRILEIQGKIIDKLVEDKVKTTTGLIKKSKTIRITEIIVGLVMLAGSTALAIWFGFAAGLRGCGSQVMEYPGYVFAIVFVYILCSGQLPAAYCMFDLGRKIKK